MNTQNLLTKSRKFKKDADKILKESGILEFLSKYGRVRLIGSYAFDIMLSGDIDLYVYIKKLNKKLAVQAMNELINQEYFRGYKFDDFIKYPDSRFPNGYYLGLRIVPKGYEKSWKIDIWFIEKDVSSERKYHRLLQNNLNQKNKRLILELKDYKIKNKLDFPSTIIYDAVLENNITDIKAFKKYIM